MNNPEPIRIDATRFLSLSILCSRSRGSDLIEGIALEGISQKDCTEGRLATGLTIFLVTGLGIIDDMSWAILFAY